MTTDPNYDSRWICWRCGDLDYLNEEGLCRECAPEPVLEFVEVCMRVLTGGEIEREVKWVIK